MSEVNDNEFVCGWRGLSLVIGERLGQPVGAGKARWAVESSGLPVGRRIGGALLFTSEDVEAAVALVRKRLPKHAGKSDGERAPEESA